MASANGSCEVVHLLLQSGAVSTCKCPDSLLAESNQKHDRACCSQNVNACNEQKNTPLHYACLLGHTEVLKGQWHMHAGSQ